MKNSKEYSSKFETFYKSLKKELKSAEIFEFETPIDALIAGVICEYEPHETAKTIMKQMLDHFVDWNDLRVSREEEVVEFLGKNSDEAKKIADNLTAALQKVFEKFDSITLEPVIVNGKRQAKQDLEEFGVLSPFVINFVMLTIMDAHCLPMTSKMIEYVKENGLVHPDADDTDINSFIERKVPASDIGNFYQVLRKHSESDQKPVKATKKTTKKKAAKKKAAKK